MLKRAAAAALAVTALAASACGTPSQVHSGAIRVVAAENFWGALATQLGGSAASVQSVVTDPNVDPHEYASRADDARAFAEADLVIVNGAGYDDWAARLIAANPNPTRRVLSVADVLGQRHGDNPHFWYDPAYVDRVITAIGAEYAAIDSGHSDLFTQRLALTRADSKAFGATIASIRATYPNVQVGSTESIFVHMAAALGLNLTSPPAFMNAISEGADPPADAVAAMQDQINGRRVRILVYNRQTATAVTTNLTALAGRAGIPVVGITETLQPPGATFWAWQGAQLESLRVALAATRA